MSKKLMQTVFLQKDELTRFGILLFFPLLGLYKYFSIINQQAVGFILFIIYLSTFIVYLLLNRYKIIIYQKGDLAIAFLLYMITFGYLQYLLYANMTLGKSPPIFVAFVLFLTYILFTTLKEILSLDKISKYVFYSFLLFFFLNIVLYSLDIRFVIESSYNEVFHKNILASMDRDTLPLFMHAVETSEAGLLIIIVSYILLRAKQIRPYLKLTLFLMYALGFYAILLGGARSALLGITLMLFLIFSKLYTSKKKTLILVFTLYLFPFWYTPLSYIIIENELLNFLSFMSRTGDFSEVLTLNNRTVIWSHTFLTYVNNIDLFHMFFGFGFGGQAPSGTASSFTYIFSLEQGDTGYETMHVHNSTLQIMVNYGIFGVILFAYILVKLLSFKKYTELNILVIIILLLGCFGVAPMSFSYVFMLLFLLIILFIHVPHTDTNLVTKQIKENNGPS